ncbi:unnamed protein product, partial [Adineta steineri]
MEANQHSNTANLLTDGKLDGGGLCLPCCD